MRKRDMAVYAVALVLAFVVGVLVGGQCAEPPPPPAAEPEPAACDPVREVVYECPPEPAEPQPAEKAGTPVKAKPRALPPADKPITPQQRQRLLAWVRDQSVDLEGCRSAAKSTYRLTVTLALDDAGRVKAVRFNAPPSELPADVQGCLKDRMRGWSPPSDLTNGRRELVFGLTL